MVLYIDGYKIKDKGHNGVFYEGNAIREIYCGSTLIYKNWFYQHNEKVFESNVSTTTTLTIKEDGDYNIWCIGGGGGGSNGTGGAGAGVNLITRLVAGTYTIVIGAGGAGAGAYVRNNDGKNGTDSSITGNGCSIIAGGGIRRRGRRNGGGGGETGTLQYSNTQPITIIERTTDGEVTNISLLTKDTSGAGAGGLNQPNDTGAGYAGKDGYIKITKI